LEALIEDFAEFRNSGHANGADKIAQGGKFLGDHAWEDSTDQVSMVENIFPENDISQFDEEIAKSPYLSEVFELADALNSMSTEDAKDPATFLRKSDWYRGRQIAGTVNQRLEAAINQLNCYRDPKQPIQCVQWGALIAGTGHNESPIDIGAVEMRGPNDIIPKDILQSPYRQKVSSPTGGIIIADRFMEMKDYKAGQLFIMITPDVGHVGVILATKKLKNGEIAILATESNRVGDGKIHTYTILGHNFDAKLGNPPNKKIIITRN
jgi:hypothetical protein